MKKFRQTGSAKRMNKHCKNCVTEEEARACKEYMAFFKPRFGKNEKEDDSDSDEDEEDPEDDSENKKEDDSEDKDPKDDSDSEKTLEANDNDENEEEGTTLNVKGPEVPV